jgi:hypothetical protein
MMDLLVTDTHWDENPDNEYRWAVFDEIMKVKMRLPIRRVRHLGDAVDRKDRFSGAFVNRLIGCLRRVAPIDVLRGNHDTPLRPPPFFSFLSSSDAMMGGVNYIDAPTPDGPLLMLPFTATPKKDWADLGLARYKAVLMHATVTGCVSEGGFALENQNFPMLPGRVRFYSGDVHNEQQVRNITYVGCPHPIHFGDKFKCRMLVVDDDFEIVEEVVLHPPGKIMIDITDPAQLSKIAARPGDQVKIRLNLRDPTKYGEMESAIEEWVRSRGVSLSSTEVTVDTGFDRAGIDLEQTPRHILRQFAEREGVSDELLAVGSALLDEVLS